MTTERKAQAGEDLLITVQTDGNGRFVSKPRRIKRKVSHVYDDGRVRDHTGEVWVVKRTSTGLVTVR